MSVLATMAQQVGLPVIKAILENRLGPPNGVLAGKVLDAVAARAGVESAQLEELAATTPGAVLEAMREVERMSPEMLAAYDADLRLTLATLAAEKDDPVWVRAWRPGWMYLLGFLWLWNLVGLHLCNAIWKIALPPLPTTDLLALTGMFLALYMGGHTVLRLMGKAGEK
jgi:hypothetical protein